MLLGGNSGVLADRRSSMVRGNLSSMAQQRSTGWYDHLGNGTWSCGQSKIPLPELVAVPSHLLQPFFHQVALPRVDVQPSSRNRCACPRNAEGEETRRNTGTARRRRAHHVLL